MLFYEIYDLKDGLPLYVLLIYVTELFFCFISLELHPILLLLDQRIIFVVRILRIVLQNFRSSEIKFEQAFHHFISLLIKLTDSEFQLHTEKVPNAFLAIQ